MKNVIKRNYRCRICASKNIQKIIDFGNVGLAGGFLKPRDFKDEKKYPQELYFCEDCYLLQIINRVDTKSLFQDYFYFSSAISTLRSHFKSYAKELTDKYLIPGKSIVLEIGCNDGVLLKPFLDLGINKLIGVDPSKNVISTINNSKIVTYNNFLTEDLAREIVNKHGQIDLICANNVFAHIDDMSDVTKAIKLLIKPSGIFVFEVHYIGSLIDEVQYDMIYHEHIYYYSLLTLQKFFSRFALEIFDIKSVPIHGGSMRYYVRHSNNSEEHINSSNLIQLQKKEYEKGYDKKTTFLNYAEAVNITKTNLISLLKKLKKKNKLVVGYGASGRANTLIQYCGINEEFINYIVDDAPMKQGFYTPGSHIEIFSRDKLEEFTPDFILIFAWSFFNEIIEKNIKYLKQGVKFIIPLPKVKIIYLESGSIVEEIYENQKGD